MPVLPACSCLSCPSHASQLVVPAAEDAPCGVYPSSSITNAQWRVLEPLLPPPGNAAGRGGRNEKHDRRRILDAIFYLARGGIAWRQLPRYYSGGSRNLL